MAADTLEQQIREAEKRLERLRAQSRAAEDAQKVILGGVVLAEARKNPKTREWLLRQIEQVVTREPDQRRLAPLVAELKTLDQAGKSEGKDGKETTAVIG